MATHEIITETPKKALLVAAYLQPSQRSACLDHLQELNLLAETYGVLAVHSEPIFLRSIDAATFITSGKLQELVDLSKELSVDFIIIDEDISPAQQRNLEKVFQKTVMDRSEVILGVFASRAQTKEARLQIELAKSHYQLPRLTRMWTHLSRQHGSGGGSGGGGGYQRGEGEKQIEIDRRIYKKKIEQLEEQIEEVKLYRQTQRQQRERSGIPVFAIVGYTNAGKSTLLNALSGSEVLVEDKLFATLDTTTRQFTLTNNQDILLIDTVGFIRKLPHLLVAAFKSTLEESLYADVLIHLMDIQHPAVEEQAATTAEVLKELGAEGKPIIHVFNKVDLDPENPTLQRMRMKYPNNVAISAKTCFGFDELQDRMIKEIKALRQHVLLRIPQKDYAAASDAIRKGNVLETTYDENDVILRVELTPDAAGRLKKYIIQPE